MLSGSTSHIIDLQIYNFYSIEKDPLFHNFIFSLFVIFLDKVIKKYKKAKSNIIRLKELGASILHRVDATKMKRHTDLMNRKFDRIIFNFPHAGFRGREDSKIMIG